MLSAVQVRSMLAEGDIQQAERIFDRGQAVALLSVDGRWSGQYREDANLIERFLSDWTSDGGRGFG